MSIIYLVRHGESSANISGLIGTPDAVLSEKGIQQARIVGQKLKGAKIQRVYVSKYQRTHQTAMEIVTEFPKPLTPITLSEIHERDFGKFSRMNPQTTLKKLKKILDGLSMEERSELRFSGDMETDLEAFTRMHESLTVVAKRNDVALVVSHSNIMRIFLVYSGFADFKMFKAGAIKNGDIIKLVFKRNKFYLG